MERCLYGWRREYGHKGRSENKGDRQIWKNKLRSGFKDVMMRECFWMSELVVLVGYVGRDVQEATGAQERGLFGDKDVGLIIMEMKIRDFPRESAE